MPRFRNRPIEIEAHQWFKNGDHPDDNCETFTGSDGKPFQGEGKVVRYFRHPDFSGQEVCNQCDHTFHEHGWIDEGEEGCNVCPGDWIITLEPDAHYPMSNAKFVELYEPIEQHAATS